MSSEANMLGGNGSIKESDLDIIDVDLRGRIQESSLDSTIIPTPGGPGKGWSNFHADETRASATGMTNKLEQAWLSSASPH